MKNHTIQRYSVLPQEKIFQISTDVENFNKVMPNYFKSLIVVEQTETEKIVIEKIKFLKTTLKIKTRHVIMPPNIHEVHILSGPTKGTVFIELYEKSGKGSKISIDIQLRLNGFMKLFGFLESYVINQMTLVMDKFIMAAEKHQHLYPNS